MFKKVSWINSTNIYEVNLRQYTGAGTFRAFENELPRLKDMGIATLWFMPVTPIAQEHKKGDLGSYYACSDYQSVNPEFGTLEDFKNLVSQAHGMGFTVLLDWVANHTGWGHTWTRQHPGYYTRDAATGNFKTASGMDDIIELDFSNPAMRVAMTDAMEFWVKECDIDGFRCDLAAWVELSFWKEARTRLQKIKTLFWLAEADPLENPEYMEVFDAMYTWTWMHRTANYYKQQEDVFVLTNILKQYETVCTDQCLPLWFTANHDENSWNGTEYEKYGAMALPLAVFSCTWYGIPMIYSGQELPNHKRLAFFTRDPIAWEGAVELHSFYKSLLDLRKNNRALQGDFRNCTMVNLSGEPSNKIIAYLRKSSSSEVWVMLNLGDQTARITVNDERINGRYRETFTKQLHDTTIEKTFELPAWGFRVLEKISG